MRHRLAIRYPPEQMEKSRLRLERTYRFEAPDRVPVLLGIEARFLLHKRGISFEEYFFDPETQLFHQLENTKWRIENIPDDWFTNPVLTVTPDFQNVTNASGCGCEILWQEAETPQSIPRFSSPEEMTRYQLPDWRTTLWGKKLEWFHTMSRIAEGTEVTLNGQRIPVNVALSINGDSPFMSAVDLGGMNFYEWLLDAPKECLRFLEMIAERYRVVEMEFRRVSGRPPQDGLNYSDDSAQVLSPDLYKQFCVPIAQRLYGIFGCERFDGRLMHLCGRNVHLHEALLEDLHITMLHGYGSGNKPGEMMTLAGRVILQGNLDPMMLYQGSRSEIESETETILERLAPYGGIILGDGYNIVPGTDLANLEVVRKASQRYGTPALRQRGALRQPIRS